MRVRRPFALLALVALFGAPCTAGAEKKAPADAKKQVELDAVTRAVQRSPLILLRIAAISLEDPADQGEALAGLVGAFLKRNRLNDAKVDFSVIKDPLWRARGLAHYADHHVAGGLFRQARKDLRDAAKLITPGIAERDDTGIVPLIAMKQVKIGDFAGALATSRRIVDAHQRIRQMLKIAERQAAFRDRTVARGSRKAMQAIVNEITSLPIGHEHRFDLSLAAARAMSVAGYGRSAIRVLDATHRALRSRPMEYELDRLTRLAEAYVESGGKAKAMKIVRALKQDAGRARALATIGAAIAKRGSREGAAPLFFLALQDIEGITDPDIRGKTLIHVIRHQATAGRLADAFSFAGKVKPLRLQHQALFAMGEALLEIGKVEEALKLVDYIADIGMRALIFAAGAKRKLDDGDRAGAARLLSAALQPTRAASTPEMLGRALPLVYETQVALGRTASANAVFQRVGKLLQQIPDDVAKVRIMTRLARAQAEGNQKDAMERSLGFAWRIAWLNKDKPAFPELLEHISSAQLAVGELLMAFDTAARIPDGSAADPDNGFHFGDFRRQPKNNALIAVAVAAARKDDARLALRAARKIGHPGARAAAYSAIALALPVRPQQAEVNSGDDGRAEKKNTGKTER